jgi:hypothetical protein
VDPGVLVSEHRIICKFGCLSQAGRVAIAYPHKGLFLGWTGSVLVYANGDEDVCCLALPAPASKKLTSL